MFKLSEYKLLAILRLFICLSGGLIIVKLQTKQTNLLYFFFLYQVEIADCMQTLFRGNSLASKIMAYCFRFYGLGYLRELLNPLIMEMFQKEQNNMPVITSYEVDPTR